MENTNVVMESETAVEKVKWGIKVRCEPAARLYEVKITLPMGEENDLPKLMEESVINAFPEIMRALASGKLPGLEIDLAGKR